MRCVIINPPPVKGYYLLREPNCSGMYNESRNPLLLYSITEVLKKYTDIKEIIPIDMSIQKLDLDNFKDFDWIILLNSNVDYSHNKEWNEMFLSHFSGEKIVVMTPSLPVQIYNYNNARTIGGIFPEQDILKIFSNEKISYNDIPTSQYDRSVYKRIRIETGRGCPYKCTYCSQANTQLMLKNPEIIIEEIKLLLKQGINFAFFGENEFTIDKNRVTKLCDLIKSQGISFKWGCQTRVDLVNKSILEQISRAGCIRISFGIESVNPITQKIIRKNLDLNNAKKIIALTKRYMMVTTYFIVGLPEETEETILNQLDFIKEVKPDYAVVFPIFAEPGTELYYQSLEENTLKNKISKRYACFNEECEISSHYLDSNKNLELTHQINDGIKKMQRKDIKQFFRRFKWRFIYNEKPRMQILKNMLRIN